MSNFRDMIHNFRKNVYAEKLSVDVLIDSDRRYRITNTYPITFINDNENSAGRQITIEVTGEYNNEIIKENAIVVFSWHNNFYRYDIFGKITNVSSIFLSNTLSTTVILWFPEQNPVTVRLA